MTYQQAVRAIAALEKRGWRLGLDRMEALVEAAGLSDALGPEKPSFIHVAGTNGKGSVTAYLQSLLVEQGWRTGAYFSPYVYDIRERIQLGRELISKTAFAKLASQILTEGEALATTEFGGPTEFEIKTAMAFAFWKSEAVDWVALEVGLGGRLDATNVVFPSACVIVSISLDHTSILGHTLAAIAREKAGIIKSGVPVIVGELPAAALEVVEGIAADAGAPCLLFGRDFHLIEQGHGFSVRTQEKSYSGLRPGVEGARQPHNMALAIAALEASGALGDPETVSEGVASASLPGRYEKRLVGGRLVILDGAHNAEAGKALSESLVRDGLRQCVLLTGMVQGHEPHDFYAMLEPHLHSIHVAPLQSARAYQTDVLAHEIGSRKSKTYGSLEEAFRAAMKDSPDLPLLVTGSFYLLCEVGSIMDHVAANS